MIEKRFIPYYMLGILESMNKYKNCSLLPKKSIHEKINYQFELLQKKIKIMENFNVTLGIKFHLIDKDGYTIDGGTVTKIFDSKNFLFTDFYGFCHSVVEYKNRIANIVFY